MQIPISDHWSQNLASFFPQAIQFIGKKAKSYFIEYICIETPFSTIFFQIFLSPQLTRLSEN